MSDVATLRFAGLSGTLTLDGCPEVGEALAAATRGWISSPADPGPGDAAAVVTVTRRRGGRYFLDAPGRRARIAGLAEITCAVLVELAHAWLADHRDHACVHCGAVALGGRLIAFPSGYRAGKSTLIAYLAATGLKVFCDDILPLAPDGRGIALGVGARLRLPLPADAPAVLLHALAAHPGPADARYAYCMPPSLARHGEALTLSGLVFLDRKAAGPARLTRLDPAAALARVAEQNLAGVPSAPAILDILHRTVTAADCYSLSYTALDDARQALVAAFAGPSAPLVPVAPAPEPAKPRRRRALAADAVLARAPGIVARPLSGELFLAGRDGAAIYNLNPLGAALWRALSRPARVDELADAFAHAFPDTPRRRIAADVARLAGDLAARGLVRVTSA